MDCFLKCYFDDFNKLPRNSLHDRRKRRAVVEYISTLIEGCRLGENCESEKTVHDAIISILRYHEKHRLENGAVCKMGKYHNILYVAIKLCYDWQLKDTGTVINLLEQIYLCERTFERLFVGAIFGTKAPHYIAGWKSDFDNQEENLRAIVYYIDHATNGGLELPYEDKLIRFIDIPIESCGKASPLKISSQLFLPDKLHILLRYGALINDFNEQISLVEQTLNRLLEFFHVYPYNIVACLQLFLRVIPTIIVEPLLELDYKSNRQKDTIVEKYSDLIDDGIIPLNRCGLEPPELKHLCRCCIRQRLWENYQLPNGIRYLPIPESLWKYVDIMVD